LKLFVQSNQSRKDNLDMLALFKHWYHDFQYNRIYNRAEGLFSKAQIVANKGGSLSSTNYWAEANRLSGLAGQHRVKSIEALDVWHRSLVGRIW
jgi:hypothetical protein